MNAQAASAPPRPGRSVLVRLLAVAPIPLTAFIGQLATTPNIPTWYDQLEKPVWTPPNGVIAPVWTALYALMAIAVWRLLAPQPAARGRGLALSLFYLQLGLNAAWSWMFFAARDPLLGMINIVPQLVVIAAAVLAAWRVDRVAGAALVPLFAWVGYAATLNAGIWALNR